MNKKILIRVTPRSSQNTLTGPLVDGSYRATLTAPPVDGAANDALIDLLHDTWAVPKSSVRIVRGKSSRMKLIEVDGPM